MNEPRRFLEGEGTDLERLLLAAGRSARPSRVGKVRTGLVLLLVGMGFGPGLVSAVRMAARRWLFTRWVALGVGSTVAAWGAVHFVASPHPERAASPPEVRAHDGASLRERARPSANAAEPTESTPESAARPAETSDHRAAAPVTSADSPTVRNDGVSGRVRSGIRGGQATSPPNKGSIGGEIRELDAARRSIEQGDPRGALERLDRYAKTYPKGAFEQEQLRLRIEALAGMGDLDSARALARSFLIQYPQSAHRKRLETLIGEQL